MKLSLLEISGYSVLLPAVLSLLCLSKGDRRFVPFYLLLWIAILVEVATTISIKKFNSNAEVSNLYVLIEASLILWFFRAWRVIKTLSAYLILLVLFLLFWAWEHFIHASIHHFGSYFRIFYSFVLTLISIDGINKLLSEQTESVLRHPLFLICIGFIIFFTYKTLVEIFWVYGLNESDSFQTSVYRIMSVINLLTNLLFAGALLWILRKSKYSLLSSSRSS